MTAYLASLERVRAAQPRRLYPGHGPIVENPAEVLEFYVRHRLEREATVLAALDATPKHLETILGHVYADVAPQVLPAARLSLAAHLEKLVAEGAVIEHEGTWRR
jgi:glyoxylase-like metal-dependent hydrolase (beta-lactamase superfamily II)